LNNSKELTKQVLSILKNNSDSSIDNLYTIISKEELLEAIYIIDLQSGLQINETIIHNTTRSLYAPTNDGHDHSLKEYYFIAKNSSRGDYLSSKYISRATGNMCRTYSAKVKVNKKEYIVCFDIIA
jgi:hypothetical protein